MRYTHRDITSLYSFSSNCSRDHQNLHSFPTRRSSDLQSNSRRTSNRSPWSGSPAPRGFATREANPRGAGLRSEEHTSELQSRRDLVCRLLLEKKKKKN